MSKLLIPVLLLLAAALPAQTTDLGRLAREKKYTELARQIEGKGVGPLEKLIYQAVLDNVFGRPAASNRLAAQALESPTGLTDSLRELLWSIRHDNYAKLFDYGQAYAAKKYLQENYPEFTPINARDDERQVLLIWETLRHEPPQEVAPDPKPVTLTLNRNRIGLQRIPVERNGRTFSFIFDTGAGISTVTETFAREFGLRLLPGPQVTIKGGITGLGTAVRLGMADRFSIGTVEVRNAFFLVFPDSALTIPLPGEAYLLDPILGFPVIKELGEITFFPDSIRITPDDGVPGGRAPNMAVDLLKPIIYLAFEGQELPFTFDSGADHTLLSEVFYEKFGNWVQANGRETDHRTGGAGGVKVMKAYTLPTVRFSTGGQSFSLSDVTVSTEKVHTADGVYYGNIGQDLIRQFRSWTVNFRESWIRFNP